jgi:hypothetical protein
MRTTALAFIFSLLALSSSSGGESEKALVERWYAALEKIDRGSFADILSDKAKITLGDLDIIQTKAEFITSLDEWEDAMRGAAIRHAIDSDADGLITVSVCYKFPDNEALGREVFAFEGGKIVGSEQETIADTCESFPG